jgi:4-hydroxybenzoate polyprenyltransferase
MMTETISASRWWTYQRERFPVLAHAPLIAAFSFSAVSYSFLLRGQSGAPRAQSIATAFVTSFIFFLQLRIADEFKDFEEDSRYRPYRPAPRGLVTLRELGVIGVTGAAIQLALALWLKPALVIVLLMAWTWLALMSKEFFVREWLKARPITYMWTHMMILPLVDLYATACDWLVAGESRPRGLLWFLAVSFFNGIVVEIGRKLRAPEDEEKGVETYTFLWGRARAVLAWLGALSLTAVCAVLAAIEIDFVRPVALLLTVLLVIAAVISWRFLQQPVSRHAKFFELMAGVWTLLMYLSLGAIPVLVRMI